MANRFQLWGQAGWASAEVVGETHYAKAIRALFGSDFNPQGTDITVPLQLIPDRNNRHDRNAVGVWSDSSLLGHLPRPEAARYVKVLTALTKRGLTPEVNAQIHGREWGEYDGRPAAFVGTIRLDLAEPHMLFPANDPPLAEHRLLPSGSAVQVNGQQQLLDALRPLLRPEGECWAYVTLHEMADHLVEVRIGDARVGDLSPKMSGELLPTLRHLSEQGLVTAARAIVKGNAGEASVMLYIARVQDLPEAWQGKQSTTGFPGTPAPFPAATPPAAGFPAAPSGYAAAASAGYSAVPTSFGDPAAAPSGYAGSPSPDAADPSAPGFPASSTPGWAAAGAPASGVTSTGPATPGAAPGPAGGIAPTWSQPGDPTPPAGGTPAPPGGIAPTWSPAADAVPGAAGGIAPAWSQPGEAVPSWAARDDATPGWTPGGSGESTSGWSAGESGLRLGIASDAGLGRPAADTTPKRDAGFGRDAASGSGPGRDSGLGRDAASGGGPGRDSGLGRGSAADGLPVRPAGSEPGTAVPSWAAPGETVPSWAASNEAAPSWAASNEAAPGWAASGEPGQNWNAGGEAIPSWAAPGDAVPSWAKPSTGVPAWAVPSASALPTLPSTGSLPGGTTPRLDQSGDDAASRPSSPAHAGTSLADSPLPGSPSTLSGSPTSLSGSPGTVAGASSPASPGAFAGSSAPTSPGALPGSSGQGTSLPGSLPGSLSGAVVPASSVPGALRPTSGQPASSASGSLAPTPASPLPAVPSSGAPAFGDIGSADPFGNPVSPAPAGAEIAETTVIPALAAVVKSNPARRSGAAPVSPAPEPNPHPPIPGAPTGIKFVVPPGWPVPPDGWYPPDGWRPDPGWPLAPAGWQWWVPIWD
ncbi:hypothetical protein AB0C07_17225 [Actinoplanes missouriensis]|uniref:hypothetical protein n=1 Tax=Actinoplanes missouriensis TaxID=1866 RepID=UPI0033EEC9EB